MSEIKTPEQIAEDLNKSIATFKEQVEKAATKEELDAINQALDTFKTDQAAKIDGLATQKALKDLEEIAIKQGKAITELKSGGNASAKVESISKALKDAVTKSPESFDELKTNQSGNFAVVAKVAGTVLTGTNTTGRVVSYERDSERSRTVRRNPFLLDLVNVSTTSAAKVSYVEQINPDGAPEMTLEGAIKPAIDFDYIEREASVKKMTASVKMSKEMMEDVDGFVADTEAELLERLNLLFDEQLLGGTGTGANLLGITVNATPFAAGALLDKVPQANNFDVIRAAVNQVMLNNFDAGVIIVNPSDAALMDLAKASDGHYVMPPFSSADGTIIKGIRVVANNGVTAGDFIVGDLSKFKVKVRETLNINYGHNADDFIKNLLTAIAEGRAASYIPTNHFGAIVKGTFAAAQILLDPAKANPV